MKNNYWMWLSWVSNSTTVYKDRQRSSLAEVYKDNVYHHWPTGIPKRAADDVTVTKDYVNQRWHHFKTSRSPGLPRWQTSAGVQADAISDEAMLNRPSFICVSFHRLHLQEKTDPVSVFCRWKNISGVQLRTVILPLHG